MVRLGDRSLRFMNAAILPVTLAVVLFAPLALALGLTSSLVSRLQAHVRRAHRTSKMGDRLSISTLRNR